MDRPLTGKRSSKKEWNRIVQKLVSAWYKVSIVSDTIRLVINASLIKLSKQELKD